MRAPSATRSKPKFPVWTRVRFPYHAWQDSDGSWDVDAEIAETSFDADRRRWHYLLKVNPDDVDRIDRGSLGGPDRNLYGWVTSRGMRRLE